MLFETVIMFIKTGFFIHSRFVLHVSFEDVVWQVAGTHYGEEATVERKVFTMEVSGRANGIPFSEKGNEEQNRVKGLKDFCWSFGGQDNRSRNVSYCPKLYFVGSYRIYSCMITNVSYVEKMNIWLSTVLQKKKEEGMAEEMWCL
jgi:hypothetical protein